MKIAIKTIVVVVALLLVNEIIIGLVMNGENTDIPEQLVPIMTSDEHTFSPPNKNTFVAPDMINVSKADGLDDLKDACLSFNDKSQMHHIGYRGVYGSWDTRTKDRHDRDSFHLASRKNHWLRTSIVYHKKEIPTTNFTSPLIFIPAIFDHSHCIHDLLFSLLPMASQGKLRDFQAVAVKRPDASEDTPAGNYTGDYCTTVMRELGWFSNITILPNNTCIDDLWVPPFIYHRFPRGWAKGTQSFSTDYIHNGDLPLESIHFFQQQMWKSFLANNKFLYKEKKGRIIFFSREGMGKGEWTNARAIAKLVQEQLDPDMFVVDVVDDVEKLAIKEQAALFQSASILVAPHGGSIANIIFMRPNGIVFELSCADEASWVRDWATDLGIRHSMVRADEPPCKVEGRRTYAIQPSTLVERILDICWKGTKKKKLSNSTDEK
mmetsp:Transcript_5625/g.12803  ORF Transcript_5625/g.12803 Transcript_5625/m.12803 type:complete len:435 (+) Transcript_5625:79-1383(+)